jgi:hypothetical protein
MICAVHVNVAWDDGRVQVNNNRLFYYSTIPSRVWEGKGKEMKIAAVQQEDRILYGGMIVAVTVCPSSRRCIPLNAIILWSSIWCCCWWSAWPWVSTCLWYHHWWIDLSRELRSFSAHNEFNNNSNKVYLYLHQSAAVWVPASPPSTHD